MGFREWLVGDGVGRDLVMRDLPSVCACVCGGEERRKATARCVRACVRACRGCAFPFGCTFPDIEVSMFHFTVFEGSNSKIRLITLDLNLHVLPRHYACRYSHLHQ